MRLLAHDDVIKWRHIPRYWPFLRGIHRSPVNSPHKGQWRGALMIPLICACIHGCANNREAGDSRRHRTHYNVTVMLISCRLIKFLQRLWKSGDFIYWCPISKWVAGIWLKDNASDKSSSNWPHTRYVQIAGCACAGNTGNVFLATDF